MVQRLATEYVKTSLVLDETQLNEALRIFQSHRLDFKVKVLDNGDREVTIEHASGSQHLVLTFERKYGKYVLEGSCRFTDLNLANAMRKVVSRFKGDALVNRIYPYYTLEYCYHGGFVVRIVEKSRGGERLVYQARDFAGELERRLSSGAVEAEIEGLRHEINHWLDRRNEAVLPADKEKIDEELGRLAHRLFVLEA